MKLNERRTEKLDRQNSWQLEEHAKLYLTMMMVDVVVMMSIMTKNYNDNDSDEHDLDNDYFQILFRKKIFRVNRAGHVLKTSYQTAQLQNKQTNKNKNKKPPTSYKAKDLLVGTQTFHINHQTMTMEQERTRGERFQAAEGFAWNERMMDSINQ